MLNLTFLDLTPMSYGSESHRTFITVKDPATLTLVPWLEFGSCWIRSGDSPSLHGLLVHPKGKPNKESVTDYDHDNVKLLTIPLTAPSLYMVHGHTSIIKAYIGPDSDDFRVPTPDFNPFEGESLCNRCAHPDGGLIPYHHTIVKNYCPPRDPHLHQLLRGYEVEIVIGRNRPSKT